MINIFEEIDDLIEYLSENCDKAEFLKAFDFSSSQRITPYPVLTFNAEASDETAYTIIMTMHIPVRFDMDIVEEVFEDVFGAIKIKIGNVSSISRDAIQGDKYGTTIVCRAVISCEGEGNDNCSFNINGTDFNAFGIDISVQKTYYDVYTIGKTLPAVSVDMQISCMGEIVGINLENIDIDESFDLTFDGYTYKNCKWIQVDYSSKSLVKTAKFQCFERVEVTDNE